MLSFSQSKNYTTGRRAMCGPRLSTATQATPIAFYPKDSVDASPLHSSHFLCLFGFTAIMEVF